MDDFFAARVDGYDEHMLREVDGCAEGYARMAALIPETAASILDLGCGTGLELDEIFRTRPRIRVTGIDLTPAMLERLRLKHPDKNLTLITGDYFAVDFGAGEYDAAISFQSLHHFPRAKKTTLYKKILRSLRPRGKYIECDYTAASQEEEDLLFAESRRLRRAQNIPEDGLFHFDTPCTADNQIAMLQDAGFASVKMVWRVNKTAMFVAEKP